MRSRCDAHRRRYVGGCPLCQVASRNYRRARVAGLADGTWERHAPTPQLREQGHKHLRTLLAVKGVTLKRISVVAGVNLSTVRRVASDASEGGMSVVSIEALLGVTAQACLALIDRSTTPVDPTGTARRLQALAVDGWSAQMLSPLVGLDESTIRSHRACEWTEITVGMRERYRDLYDKIQSQADPRGGSWRARRNAEERGWLGPERWADEEIDDPDARPLPAPPEDSDDWVAVSNMVEGALRDPRPGKAADYPRSVQREIARQAFHRLGWSLARIGELFGKTSSTVEYLLKGRRDRPQTQRAGA